MIQRPSNWSEVQAYVERPKLPAGAYVCRIIRATVQNNSYGDQLILNIDIVDGEYANYYTNDFDNNTNANKKWRGVYKLFLPKNDGSAKDEWTKSRFKAFITSVEKSNRSYVWDWNELSLMNKEIGIIFRSEEWSYNGKHGWTTRPFRACSLDTVQDGTYTIPAPKPLASSGASSAFTSYDDDEDGDALPF